jgi:amidase
VSGCAEVLDLDAVGQAAAVRDGRVRPVELVEAAIERIEQQDGPLNAVIHRRFAAALEEVGGVAGRTPFAGVPLLVKDMLCATAGDPYHLGMRLLRERGWRASADSHLAGRFRAAGFVILGRTNTPELATAFVTEPAAYGPTRNPWDLASSPGGSSGGSAAAVAAGLVAVAHGNDMGGSIRVPASSCGLVGLKPTRARTSLGPDHGEYFAMFTHEGVLTRSVRDTAAVLDAIAGPAPGDPYQAPPPAGTFAAAAARPPRRLRIGFTTTLPFRDRQAHPECVRAVATAATVLEGAGHVVEPAAVAAFGGQEPVAALTVLFATFVRRELDRWGARLGISIGEGDVEPRTWALAEAGDRLSAATYLAAVDEVQAYGRRVAGWWTDSGADLLLTPTVGIPPPRIGTTDEAVLEQLGAFTVPFNVTGQPAVSVPLHWTAEGLPVGVQLVAPHGGEELLLSVAGQLEQSQPWAHRRPPAGGGQRC